MKLPVNLRQFLRTLRTHVDLQPDLVGDGVDRCAAAHNAGDIGGLGIGRWSQLVHLNDGCSHGRHRIDQTIGAIGMPARSLEGDAVAPGADRAVGDDIGARSVHRDEGRDPILVAPLAEQIAGPAQVPGPFLADIADEQDVAPGADVGGVERAKIPQQHRQGAGVIADPRRGEPGSLAPDRHIGSFREDGVEVGRQDDHGPAGRAAPAPKAHHIALGVHLEVRQAVGLQHRQIGVGADFFLERRRRDLGQGDDVADDTVMLGIEGGERGPEAGAGANGLQGSLGVVCRARRRAGRAEGKDRGEQRRAEHRDHAAARQQSTTSPTHAFSASFFSIGVTPWRTRIRSRSGTSTIYCPS